LELIALASPTRLGGELKVGKSPLVANLALALAAGQDRVASPDGRWMYFSADAGNGLHIWRQRVGNERRADHFRSN